MHGNIDRYTPHQRELLECVARQYPAGTLVRNRNNSGVVVSADRYTNSDYSILRHESAFLYTGFDNKVMALVAIEWERNGYVYVGSQYPANIEVIGFREES